MAHIRRGPQLVVLESGDSQPHGILTVFVRIARHLRIKGAGRTCSPHSLHAVSAVRRAGHIQAVIEKHQPFLRLHRLIEQTGIVLQIHDAASRAGVFEQHRPRLRPVHQITRYGMGPLLLPVTVALRLELVVQVIFSGHRIVNQSVRVIHPLRLRRIMKLRTAGDAVSLPRPEIPV